MAVIGLFTNEGIAKSIDASNDQGFYVEPFEFGVSRTAGPLTPTLTTPNAGLWYQAPITSRTVINTNTIKVTCVVPPGAIATQDEIQEIYLFGKDSGLNEFLLAYGQPTEPIQYDPLGNVTLELQITMVDIDLTAQYVFSNTSSTDLDSHKQDPNAHIEYPQAMAKAGIFLPAGGQPPARVGQNFDELVEFDGTRATADEAGVTWQARFNGDEYEGLQITFDGIKDRDAILEEFNIANPLTPIEHDGTPTGVPAAGIITLSGGSYIVENKDVVYKDVDGVYKQAVANGTIQSKVAGMAFLAERMVRGIGGFVDIATGFTVGDDLYLSDTNPGKITDIGTATQIGHQVDTDYIFFGGTGAGGSGGLGAGYDAIVTDEIGFMRYSTLQAAIDAVPMHGFILVDKLEELQSRVRTNGKTVNIVSRGYSTGLVRFLGRNDIQRVTFDPLPDSGTFRLEYRDPYTGVLQQTNDLAWNVSAAALEAEINLLTGHSGCTVTLEVDGYTVEFDDYIDLPLLSIDDPGLNEIQRFEFDQISDDGTIDFEFEGNSGVNHAFNDTPSQLFNVLINIPNINDIEIRGSLEQKYYEIEFKGVDGLQNKNPISVINSNLNVGGSGGFGGVQTEVNGTTTFPVDAIIVQEGRFPSQSLQIGSNPITVGIAKTQVGAEVGPSKAMELDSHNNQFIGMGRFVDFNTGIDMSAFLGTRIEVHFDNVELPLDGQGQILGRNFSFDGSIGIEKDAFDAKPIYETPAGTIDGVNAVFTLNQEPNTDSQLALLRDQLWLRPDWYSIAGVTITITEPLAIPALGQDLLAWYTPDVLDFTPDITYYPWFYNEVPNIDNEFLVPTGASYNRGSDRLEVYRNGMYQNIGSILGDEVDRYQEFSETEISLSLLSKPFDVWSLVNKDIRVLSRGELTGVTGATLTVPTYAPGTNDIRIWKNGILLSLSEYAETDANTITPTVAPIAEDIFSYMIYEFNGTREEVTGFTGTNLASANTLAGGKYMVFRDGLLMLSTLAIGDAIDRYVFFDNFNLTLEVAAVAAENFTIITF